MNFKKYSSKEHNIKIDNPDFDNLRVDKLTSFLLKDFLKQDFSRARVINLIEDGHITVNGVFISKSYKVRFGDVINIKLPELKQCDVLPEKIALDIVYEDDDILIVNKPKDMVVHPANGVCCGTLVNALLYHAGDSLSGINGVARPGIVHRIDKNTSGLLIVAKNDYAHIKLSQQIKEHSFKRVYHAVVYGNLKNDEGVINLPIGRSRQNRKKMAVSYVNSKPAKTIYQKIKDFDKFCYIKLRLETGRTHQIRVHMSHIGHPVAGDDVYGPQKVIKSLNGQCLHAKKIGFIHPVTQKYMEFDSELPRYFQDFLNFCEKQI